MSLFTILPITVADATLPQIPSSDVEFFGEGELNSYDHWILNTGPSSLQGIVNQKLLTPASTAPTYASNYIEIEDVNASALKTDLFEPAATGGYTLCGVIRQPAAVHPSLMIGWGTLGAGVENRGGSTYYAGSNQWLHTYRGAASSISTGLAMSTQQWYWVGVSVQYVNNTAWTAYTLLGGVGDSTVGPGSGTYIPNAVEPISLGNVDYTNNTGVKAQWAEFVLFDNALTLSEMQGIYARSKVRMDRRGITI